MISDLWQDGDALICCSKNAICTGDGFAEANPEEVKDPAAGHPSVMSSRLTVARVRVGVTVKG